MFCQHKSLSSDLRSKRINSLLKIVIAEKISTAALEQLQEPGWTVLSAEQLDGKLSEHLESADALIVRSAVQANAALLSHAKKLRVIGRAGVGVDNIDLDTATRQGIAVMNTPGANAVAVAEQTLGMMLAMARHLCRADALMHAGKWEKKSLQGTELRAKTLGIVGLGRGGRARLAWSWWGTIRLCRCQWRRTRGSGWPGSTSCMERRTTSRCTSG